MRKKLFDTKSGTVFAPVDSAFEDLPEGYLNCLLKEPKKLDAILQMHYELGQIWAPGSKGFSDGATLTVEGGQVLTARQDRGGAWMLTYPNNKMLVQVKVLKVLPASNGVVHMINKVMVPPGLTICDATTTKPPAGLPSIGALLESTSSLSNLLLNVNSAGLMDLLKDESGTYTVFAPTTVAFERLPASILDAVATSPKLLKSVLLSHVVTGSALMSTDLQDGRPIKTAIPGVTIKAIKNRNMQWQITNSDGSVVANFETVDVKASNGVVHIIDAVLLPAEYAPTTTPETTTTMMAKTDTSTTTTRTTITETTTTITTITTTTTGTTTTTTTIYDEGNVDCKETQDACTAACQEADDRNYKVSQKAVAKGKACTGPTDCKPGDGACPLPTTTTTTTTTTTMTTVTTVTTAKTTSTKTATTVTTVTTTVAPTIAEALGSGKYKTNELFKLLTDASLTGALGNPGQMTIFAPVDAAFDSGTVKAYLGMTAGNQKAILEYHVLSSKALQRTDFQVGDTLATFGTSSTLDLINLGADSWSLRTESDQAVEIVRNPAAVQCSNGVIHFVRKVLMPGAVFATDAPDTADTSAAATTEPSGGNGTPTPAASKADPNDKSKTIIYAAAAGGGGLVLIIVVIVLLKVCKGGAGGGSGGGGIVGAQTFDNPMYDMNDPYSNGTGGGGKQQGYVPPEYATANEAAGSFNDVGGSGYMDISPTPGGDSAGYMDVSAQGYDGSEA